MRLVGLGLTSAQPLPIGAGLRLANPGYDTIRYDVVDLRLFTRKD